MLLIWDTSALNEVIRAVAYHINNTPPPGSAPTRAQEYLDRLDSVFAGLEARCGCQNFTSDQVFATEIDTQQPGCQLRNQEPLIDAYCAEADFIDRWQDILERRLTSEEVTEVEVNSLRPIIPDDIGIRDLTLIAAALKLGNARRLIAVVVTDDVTLSEQVLTLKRRPRNVTLAGVQYSTEFLSVYLSLEALRDLHLSCGIDNEFWHSVILSFKVHHNGRQQAAARKHDINAISFLERYPYDCEEKQRRDITRDIAQVFGEDDA